MTKSELEQRIEELEDRIFLIDMIDVWQQKEYELYDKLSKEIKELKEQLNNFPKQKPQKLL